MRVRSFEIHGVGDGHLRALHDHLMETGGFEFRAGGRAFFVVVGERFAASSASTLAQMIMAAREDDTINVDVVITGGAKNGAAELADAQRATELLRGFAERQDLAIDDI